MKEENNIVTNTEITKIEFTAGLLGLEKIWTPTLEYAGEQIKTFVQWLVESALKKAKEKNQKEQFHGLPQMEYYISLPTREDMPLFIIESRTPINPFAQFPEWYWPVGEKIKNIFLNNFIPINDNFKELDRNVFANLLCKSLSLSQVEKQRVIDKWPELKKWQIESLIEIFEEEIIKWQELAIDYTSDVWGKVYESQLDWSKLMLKDDIIGTEKFIVPQIFGEFLFPYFALWSEFWIKSGNILMRELKDYRNATRAFDIATRLEPNNPYPWYVQGYCFIRLQYFKFAFQCYSKVSQLRPNHLNLKLDLIELHILNKEFNKGYLLLEKLNYKELKNYGYVYITLKLTLDVLTNCIDNLFVPKILEEYINDSNNINGWNFKDLKKFISSQKNINDKTKRQLTIVFNKLIALED